MIVRDWQIQRTQVRLAGRFDLQQLQNVPEQLVSNA
jgi:hypothetical protein